MTLIGIYTNNNSEIIQIYRAPQHGIKPSQERVNACAIMSNDHNPLRSLSQDFGGGSLRQGELKQGHKNKKKIIKGKRYCRYVRRRKESKI